MSDEPELLSYFTERRQSLVQVSPGMGCRDLAAHSCLPLRHHRITEAGDKDPLLQQQVAHSDGRGGLTQDHWNNRCLAGKRPEAEPEKLIAEVTSVFPQGGNELRVLLQVLDAGKRACRHRWGQGIGEKL